MAPKTRELTSRQCGEALRKVQRALEILNDSLFPTLGAEAHNEMEDLLNGLDYLVCDWDDEDTRPQALWRLYYHEDVGMTDVECSACQYATSVAGDYSAGEDEDYGHWRDSYCPRCGCKMVNGG